MKKNRIPALAAALLLLPLGLAGVSGPAVAQPRNAVVAQATLIERFVIRPAGRLKVGDEVRFRVRGVSGARAWVDVPRVASGIALREVRSGIYEGEYTIRRGDALDFSQAVATVQRGRDRHSLQVDLRGDDRDEDFRWARDDRPPQVGIVAPAAGQKLGERGRVRIAARLDDPGSSGIARETVTLHLNGRDVTRQARVTDDGIEYRQDLEPGRYKVEVTVRDRAGNLARRNWNFVVADDVKSRPPAPHALEVTSHKDLAFVNVDKPLTVRGRTSPNALVRVEANFITVRPERAPTVRTVRADARGDFVATLPAINPGEISGRVDLVLTSTGPGRAPATQLVKLLHMR